MTWWMWLVLGLVLLAGEVIVPGGIILLFFGVAAMIVGALAAGGLDGPAWFQWLLFSGISIVSLLTLRGPILRKMTARDASAESIDTLLGKSAVVLDDLAPGAEGKVELRGAPWTAENTGEAALVKGQKCVVERVDGLKLFVHS